MVGERLAKSLEHISSEHRNVSEAVLPESPLRVYAQEQVRHRLEEQPQSGCAHFRWVRGLGFGDQHLPSPKSIEVVANGTRKRAEKASTPIL